VSRPYLSATRLLLGSACVLASFVCPGCGDGTGSGPSGSGLQLTSGRQLIDVLGFDASTDPNFPPCSPTGVPAQGKIVDASLTLSLQSSVWVAVPEVSTDTFEITVQGQSNAVTGTVTGVLTDTSVGAIGASSGRGVSVNFSPGGAPASFTGTVASLNGGLVSGRVSGSIRFMDTRTGASSTCSAVQLTFQPLR
jgi:hypothetical protein